MTHPQTDQLLLRFGQRVRYFRKMKKLTQEELALRMQLDPSYIGHIECGRRNIQLRRIFQLARMLRVKPEELFK